MPNFVVIILASLISMQASWSNADAPKDLVKLSLIKFNDHLAVTFQNKPKWHTYWKNPGDAGLPIKFAVTTSGKDHQISMASWPAPKKYIEEGNILAYGYEGLYSFFIKDNFKENTPYELDLKWLICKNICIPGKAKLGFVKKADEIEVVGQQFRADKNILKNHWAKLPKEAKWPKQLNFFVSTNKDGTGLELHYTYPYKSSLSKGEVLLIPYPLDPWGWKHEDLRQNLAHLASARMPVEWNGEYMEPEMPLPKDGKFKKPFALKFLFRDAKGAYQIISQNVTSFKTKGHATRDEFFNVFKSIDGEKKKSDSHSVVTDKQSKGNKSTETPKTSFIFMLLMAFIGGCILNLMPCVLPVISLKLFGLIKHQEGGHKRVLSHNLFYSLGVVSTFLVFAVAVLILKTSGEQVGWGFHMQSPTFIAFMIIMLFIMTLNFFGLFEFGTPGGRTLARIELKDGPLADFSGGVLATILSTPCSAPFLGTALTYAFTTTQANIIIIFTVIALGLASPFIITGFFPAMIQFLPKPGAWMDKFRKILGLTILLTVVWLIDVFSIQVNGSYALTLLNISLSLIFFVFYLYNRITKSWLWTTFFTLISLSMLTFTYSEIQQLPNTLSTPAADSETLRWSRKAMNENKGHLVFIDFTAKWCFTCKVNEKLVINTDGFKSLLSKYQVRFMLGDWTNRNEEIGNFLEENNKVGIPAYFVMKKDGDLIDLGETISLSEIEEAFKKASQ